MSRVDPERRHLNRLIEQGIGYLREANGKAASTERAYREAKGATWATVKSEGGRTAEHMKDEVQKRVAGLGEARDVAAGEVKAAMEVLRLRRQQLSAWQTDQNGDGVEFDHAMYGPDEPGEGS